MVGRQDVQGLLERRLRLLPAIQGPIGESEVVMGGPYPRTLWKLTEELPRLPDRLLPVGAPEPRRLRPGQVVLHAILADEHPGLPERSREVSEPKTAVSTLVMHALAE